VALSASGFAPMRKYKSYVLFAVDNSNENLVVLVLALVLALALVARGSISKQGTNLLDDRMGEETQWDTTGKLVVAMES